ncbi:MAG: hypothetical protein ACJAS1_005141 [Oleiphilaceae bacterium]|jgi:hypothetical protein
MSKEKLCNLLRMICDPVKRQLLIEFRVIRFCLSNQIRQVVDDNEDEFYEALSKLEIDENGYADVSFFTLRLFISAIVLKSELDSNQSESTIFMHIVAINEEIQHELEKKDIKEFLDSGVNFE